jgi:hypothetical protein
LVATPWSVERLNRSFQDIHFWEAYDSAPYVFMNLSKKFNKNPALKLDSVASNESQGKYI